MTLKKGFEITFREDNGAIEFIFLLNALGILADWILGACVITMEFFLRPRPPDIFRPEVERIK
jgi:hypothetical protein